MPLYFIALIPPAPLSEEITGLKQEFKSKYAAKHALKLPAHLTLQIPFKLDKEREPELKDLLQSIAHEQKTFEVKLSGFGAFPPRVIFIKVTNPNPVVDLHEKIQGALDELFSLQDGEKTRELHPHFTIATRDLKRKIFPSAWEEFSKRNFDAAFVARQFSLFRHNGKTWDRVAEFSFVPNIEP